MKANDESANTELNAEEMVEEVNETVEEAKEIAEDAVNEAEATAETAAETVGELTEEAAEIPAEVKSEALSDAEVIKAENERWKAHRIAKRKENRKKAFKNFLKKNKSKLIGYPIFIAVVIAIVLLAKHFSTKSTTETDELQIYRFDEESSKDPITISNNNLTLVFDPATTLFTLTDKFGHVWNSASIADDATHSELKANVTVAYVDTNGTPQKLNSYSESVKRGNYTYDVDYDNKKITIMYTIGKVDPVYYVPKVLTKERYDELFQQIKDKKAETEGDEALETERGNLQSYWKNAYIMLTKEKLDRPGYKDYLEMYPGIVESIEAGETVPVLSSTTQSWKKQRMMELLQQFLDYGKEECEADQEQYGVEEGASSLPAINLHLVLQLDGDDLIATIPYDTIEYKKTYPAVEVSVLPYMLSEPSNSEGYLFVPDGSGAIVNFNNGKCIQPYEGKIYGQDYALTQDSLISSVTVNYPIYGIAVTARTGSDGNRQELNQAMLAIIEEGDSYGTVRAGVPSSIGVNVNYTNTLFTAVHSEKVNVGTRSIAAVLAYEEKLNKNESIKIRYKMIDSTSYVDMAKTYRAYYQAKYPEVAQKSSGELPVAVELVGAVTKRQHILGFPKERPFAVTTYSQMTDIIKELNDAGMSNIRVILEGWFNEGVKHEVADDVDLIGVLGGKSDFKKAISSIGQNNTVIVKANFSFVYHDELFDSFHYRRCTAKYLSREYVKKEELSKLYYTPIEENPEVFYLATPEYIQKTIDGFVSEIADYDLKNIAFNDYGNSLSADYNRKRLVTRETVKAQQRDEYKKLQSGGSKLVTYDPYEYSIPYCDILLDMDVDSDGFSLLDDSIPFFPIVLHGYKDFTGAPLNITGDFTNNLLKSAESGAGLYFIFMEKETRELMETKYTYLFGANYDTWKDDAISWYKRFKDDFGGLYGLTIENHEIIDKNIKMTEYSDGTKVYVNYRTAEYTTADGITIPAQDWVVKKGGN